MPKITPQDIVVNPANAAVIIVLTVHEGSESVVRGVLADAPGLIRAVGFRAKADRLTATVGVGSDA